MKFTSLFVRFFIIVILYSCVFYTPISVPSQTLYLDWHDWYPLDRAQMSGERTQNRWVRETTTEPNVYYFGQSTWQMPGTPAGFPSKYQGRTIDYFTNWICGPESVDPNCEAWHIYREFMSQGTAYNDPTYLEHWARGTQTNWEVYFSTDAFSKCDGASVTAVSNQYLKRADIKEPFVMRLPATVGETFISPVVCAVSFSSYNMQNNQVMSQKTGLWFVINQTLERYEDENGYQIIKAENQYYTDNLQHASEFDNWCEFRQDDTHCVMENGHWHGLIQTHDGVIGHLYAYEQYWMREVPQNNRLFNGFGAFHWWSWGIDELDWDDTQIWSTDTCATVGDHVFCAQPVTHLYLPLIQ